MQFQQSLAGSSWGWYMKAVLFGHTFELKIHTFTCYMFNTKNLSANYNSSVQ